MNIPRALSLPSPGQRNFFLWGQRQVGKSTLLNQLYPPQENYWVDLLDSSVHREYFNYPERLRQNLQEYLAQGTACLWGLKENKKSSKNQHNSSFRKIPK